MVKTRATCPRCESSLAEGPRWDDPEQSRDRREGKLHAANKRMRNSGAGLFVVGIVLMSQSGETKQFLSLGVFFIVIGTTMFLWGWKLLQMEKHTQLRLFLAMVKNMFSKIGKLAFI